MAIHNNSNKNFMQMARPARCESEEDIVGIQTSRDQGKEAWDSMAQSWGDFRSTIVLSNSRVTKQGIN